MTPCLLRTLAGYWIEGREDGDYLCEMSTDGYDTIDVAYLGEGSTLQDAVKAAVSHYHKPRPRQGLPAMPSPVARHSDPSTSHAAAGSVGSETRQDTQAWILGALKCHVWLSDIELRNYRDADEDAGLALCPVSDSGLRTRRKELVDAGLVQDSGMRRPHGKGGRNVIVWELA